MALITTEQAMDHLRLSIDGDEYVSDVELKAAQAEAHVLTYLKRDPAAVLTATQTLIIQAAILEVLANLFFDRGDRDRPTDGPVTPRVRSALSLLRDPSLA